MDVQRDSAGALEVTIDILREACGFFSAYVFCPAGKLIVLTPPCEDRDGAVQIAKAMWRGGELILPPFSSGYGTA